MGAHVDPQRSHPNEVIFSALLALCASLEAGEICGSNWLLEHTLKSDALSRRLTRILAPHLAKRNPGALLPRCAAVYGTMFPMRKEGRTAGSDPHSSCLQATSSTLALRLDFTPQRAMQRMLPQSGP